MIDNKNILKERKNNTNKAKNLKDVELKKVSGGEDGYEYFPIKCPKCGEEFNTEEDLKKHMAKCLSGTNYVGPSSWK